MSQGGSLDFSSTRGGARLAQKLRRFLSREDLRQHPLKGIYSRFAWRLRWRVSRAPWLVHTNDGLPLLILDSGVGALIYFQGASDPELAGFIKHFLKPGMVFVDVGAHLGEYTILAATIVKDRGCVHAFEARADTFEILRRNVELNRLTNVRAQPWAAWSEEGFCAFEKTPDPSVSALRPGQSQIEGGPLVKVKTVTLDRYFADSGAARPDLIKIDVEGAELEVLKGARSVLSSPLAPALIVEYGLRRTAHFGHTPDEGCDFLKAMGYEIYQWNGAGCLTPVRGRPVLPATCTSCNLLATKTALSG